MEGTKTSRANYEGKTAEISSGGHAQGWALATWSATEKPGSPWSLVLLTWVSREARLMAWEAQVIQHEPNKKAVEVSSPPPPAPWPPHHEGLSPVCPSLPSLVKLSVQNCTSSRPVPLIKRPVSSSSSAPLLGLEACL